MIMSDLLYPHSESGYKVLLLTPSERGNSRTKNPKNENLCNSCNAYNALFRCQLLSALITTFPMCWQVCVCTSVCVCVRVCVSVAKLP